MGFLQNRIQRRGAEARRVFVRVGAILFLFCMLAGVQNLKPEQKTKSTAADAAPKVVPITEEQHHHLVLDNDYVRVFHVEVPPHSETLYHQHDMDYVFVTLGDSKVASERVDGKSTTLELKDGDTRFTKGGFAHKAVNLSDKPFVNVTIEMKRPADAKWNASGSFPNSLNVGKELLKADGVTCMDHEFESGIDQLPIHGHVLMVAMKPVLISTLSSGSKTLNVGDILWLDAPAQLGSSRGSRVVLCDFGHNPTD
jgi:beta-alanine degradation protein BauB